MLNLASRIETRFPQWFDGARGRLSRPMVRSLSRLSRLDAIDGFLRENAHLRGLVLVEAALEWLDCRYLVDQIERQYIPERGRAVIVANHPLGALDALVLLSLVGSVRSDVKILANDFLLAIDGLSDLFIPLRILGGKPGADSLRGVDAALERDQAVIVFPAGEVSRFGIRGIEDSPWRSGFLRFAQRADAAIVPVHVQGRNSAFFYATSSLLKPLATGLLAREMFRRRQTRVVVRVAPPRPVKEVTAASDNRAQTCRDIRNAVYTMGSRSRWTPAQAPLIHGPNARAIRADLDQLVLLGETSDGKRIHGGPLPSDSALLREIGRLREQTFRAVGEGTGRRFDLDAYDTWYEHIVLWDADNGEVAGAYRAADCAHVLDSRGARGLYTASLFAFDGRLLPTIERGVELGRSFVQARYWGTRSLDYLWYGIGAWLRSRPDIRYLFGPVSISANLPLEARELLVAYYTRYYGHPQALARSAHPFAGNGGANAFANLDRTAAMQILRNRLDALGATIPMLYKQYTELCEPGGTQFLSFGVDPAFNNSVDGLILVDLAQVKAKKRERYITGGISRRAQHVEEGLAVA